MACFAKDTLRHRSVLREPPGTSPSPPAGLCPPAVGSGVGRGSRPLLKVGEAWLVVCGQGDFRIRDRTSGPVYPLWWTLGLAYLQGSPWWSPGCKASFAIRAGNLLGSFNFFGHTACGILVPWPGIKPACGILVSWPGIKPLPPSLKA